MIKVTIFHRDRNTNPIVFNIPDDDSRPTTKEGTLYVKISKNGKDTFYPIAVIDHVVDTEE